MSSFWLPENISTVGQAIDRLFYLILWITGAIFIGVQAMLLWFVIRYRQRPGQPARYHHGSTPLELIWTIIPTLILIYLGFASQKSWAMIRGTRPDNATVVKVTAEQFAWNVHYPGLDGHWDTADDLHTINQLHLPVHAPVVIQLTSKDVIHSFFVAQARLKLDAVPGLTGHLWLQLTKPGQYEIACAELCGLGHYRMRGFLTVESTEAFQRWLTEQAAALPVSTEASPP